MARLLRVSILAAIALCASTLTAQSVTIPGRSPNRGIGIPNATPAQNGAITEIQKTLQPFSDALAAARDELARASYVHSPNDSALRAAVEKVANADLALANARLRAFTELQQGPNRLQPGQIPAFIALLTGRLITFVF